MNHGATRSVSVALRKCPLTELLIEIREKTKKSQADIARDSWLNESYVSRLFSDERTNPSRDALILLGAFGLELPVPEVDELLLTGGLQTASPASEPSVGERGRLTDAALLHSKSSKAPTFEVHRSAARSRTSPNGMSLGVRRVRAGCSRCGGALGERRRAGGRGYRLHRNML